MTSTAPSPSPATTPPAPADPILLWLRLFAVLTALFGIAQALLGFTMLGGIGGVFSLHRMSGYLTFVVAAVAAVVSVLWARRSGNKGLMFHALSVAVLALVQVGLAEAHMMIWVHAVIGVLFLVAAVALATLALRRGGAGRAQRRAARTAS